MPLDPQVQLEQAGQVVMGRKVVPKYTDMGQALKVIVKEEGIAVGAHARTASASGAAFQYALPPPPPAVLVAAASGRPVRSFGAGSAREALVVR